MQDPTDRTDISYISAVLDRIIAESADIPAPSIDFDGDSLDDSDFVHGVDVELREQFEKIHDRRH